jgi:hypothetical protein
MDREKELPKLINVLRRTGSLAIEAIWMEGGKDSAESTYCAERYNNVLNRLKESDTGIAAIFDPLPPDTSLAVVAMGCQQLAAYYEDEVSPERLEHRLQPIPQNDLSSFNNFWQKSPADIEDFVEFSRESIGEWERKSITEWSANTDDAAKRW